MKLQNASQPKELSPLSALAAGASGNLIEWYEGLIYGLLGGLFASIFLFVFLFEPKSGIE